MIEHNRSYNSDFESFIKPIDNEYFNFANDDFIYELGYENGKDYDDSKGLLDWNIIQSERFRTLKQDGSWGIWCGWSNAINIILDILESSSDLTYQEIRHLMKYHTISDIFNHYSQWIWKNWIVWARQKGRGAKHDVVSVREDFIWLSKSEKPIFNRLESNIPKKTKGFGTKNGKENRIVTNTWTWDDIPPIFPGSEEHKDGESYKGQKPVALIDRTVRMMSNPGDIGHDGFCGSGTFAVACIAAGRDFIVSDKSKNAIRITDNRIEKERKRPVLFVS